jgi:hypothetical protein
MSVPLTGLCLVCHTGHHDVMLDHVCIRCLKKQRDEARRLAEECVRAKREALEHAAGRWSEWGCRAESVAEILESIPDNVPWEEK